MVVIKSSRSNEIRGQDKKLRWVLEVSMLRGSEGSEKHRRSNVPSLNVAWRSIQDTEKYMNWRGIIVREKLQAQEERLLRED